MRDRLIEKIKGIPHGTSTFGEVTESLYIENVMVKHLLENGVIVPPCMVGDVIYNIHGGKVFGGKIIMINVLDGYLTFAATGGRYFCDDDIGKSVFLTKEEAEQALKGGEESE